MRIALSLTLVLLASAPLLPAPVKPYTSPIVTRSTPGHRVAIDVAIAGAKRLVLRVSDGGNGSGYDWADWMEPRLVGPKGERKLTELEVESSEGRYEKNKNQAGGPLEVNGESVAYGFGVHANSELVFKIPPGYERFVAHGGLDNGGTDQDGSIASVQFHVSTRNLGPVSQLAEGFHVDVLYHADLQKVGSWVVLAVDGKGRLLTADRQGPLYRIEVPEIGAEDQEVKVERLPVEVGGANGILEAFGSLYVVGKGRGSRRGKDGFYRLTDTTGDDHYDLVEFLIPLAVGSDHHAHNILLHPDGQRLTILSGNNTNVPGEITTRNIRYQQEDHLLPRGTYYGHNTGREGGGGFVLICKPDGSERRLHCAGFRNPYDFGYNRDGELFTFDADMEYDVGGPWYRPTRVNHTVSGADFGWRWGAGKWPEWYPDTVGSVVDIGRGSPTGATFGYGAKFPVRYQNAFFIADWTYGRMFAVHLTPKGASYSGVAEPFVQGRGMPISDVVIRPQDGSMYYVTGGRRQKTRLFRVTYVGEESTAPHVHQLAQRPEAELRALRQRLEAFHGNEYPGTVRAAWPHLAHADRAIRFAARTAIEHQPLETWAELVVDAKSDLRAIEGAVALARAGGKDHRDRLLARLARVPFAELALEQRLDLLRAYGLVFIRLGKPDEATRQHLVKTLSPHYASGTESLDRELCQMLLYLGAPKAVTRTVDQLLAAETQASEMFYAYHLRTIEEGWSDEDRARYFAWIGRTERRRGDYVGGGHFANFLKHVRGEATKRLSKDEQKALASLLETQKPPPPPTWSREVVREWTLAELEPALGRVSAGRAFLKGKKISEAICQNCHLFKGRGGALGPDLTSVGAKMDAKALLLEILEPSRVISEQHASTVYILKNGQVIDGREVGSDESSVQVAANPRKPTEITTIQKGDILRQEISKVSLMPEGLLNVLHEEEILDLIMYLRSGGQAGNTAFDR